MDETGNCTIGDAPTHPLTSVRLSGRYVDIDLGRQYRRYAWAAERALGEHIAAELHSQLGPKRLRDHNETPEEAIA